MVKTEDALDGQSSYAFPGRSLVVPGAVGGHSKSRPRLSTVLKAGSYGKGKHFERREDSFVPMRSISAGAPPLIRRLSHPLHLHIADSDDGDFIKKAFENLSVEPTRQPSIPPKPIPESTDAPTDVSLIDILNNDDPLGVGVSIRRVAAKNNSRSSIASSISSPPSAASFADRSSLASTKPLLAKGSTAGNGKTKPISGTKVDHENTPVLSESSFQWTDPFEDANSRLRLRRRSTISGYSITSSDYLSLRRGSYVSFLDSSSSQGKQNNGSSSENPFTAANVSGSMRWEQWALAYKDTMLQHMQANVHQVPAEYTPPATASVPPRPLRPKRNPSFADTVSSSASVHEQANLFYPLRRQFVAKAGSRSEGNRILIIELCHALEEYATTLTAQWEGQQRSPSFKPSSSSSPKRRSLVNAKEAEDGCPLERLHLLAGEVDSLVREIVEAVPAFSYALGQGNYGPLPFPINNGHSIPEEPSIRGYLEQIQVLPRQEAGELGETDQEMWWPARLRADLNEGLLLDGEHESPSMNLHSFAMVVPVSAEDMGRSWSGNANRNDELLEEGRRRWQEYKQARQR